MRCSLHSPAHSSKINQPRCNFFMNVRARPADFIGLSIHYLRENYIPKIRKCLSHLNEEDIWWRPNESSNSIGNLILHLAGNARQWIVSGVGQQPDLRNRQAEFDELGPISTEALLTELYKTIDEVCSVLEDLEPPIFSEKRVIQGNTVSVLEAIYHVVEHFAMHTGQIIYIAKLRSEQDLAFYFVTDDGEAHPRW